MSFVFSQQNGTGHNGYNWFSQRVNGNGSLGGEISHGTWGNGYSSCTGFTAPDGKKYFYSQQGPNDSPFGTNHNWFIQALNDDGSVGAETDHGTWKDAYSSCAAVTIGGRCFLYSQRSLAPDATYWFIQELLAGGKIGAEISHGSDIGRWFNSCCTIVTDQGAYVYAQERSALNTPGSWAVFQIKSDGTRGSVSSGRWNNGYSSCCSYRINGRYFIYSQQDLGDNLWFIQEMKSDGTLGSETDHGQWKNPYVACCSIIAGGNSYVYSVMGGGSRWFLQNIQAGGKMGNETGTGSWNNNYGSAFGFPQA